MSKDKKTNAADRLNMIKLYGEGWSMQKIADLYKVDLTNVDYHLKKANVKKRSNRINSKKYVVDENFFEKIDSKEKAYWLGFIYADGYITQGTHSGVFGLSLGIQDVGHLEKLKQSLKATYPINIYNPNSGGYSMNQYCRLLITSNKIVDDLQHKGVIFNKTLLLTAPNKKQLPQRFKKDFIRGYFDGDGSISYSNPQYKFRVIGTLSILDYIKEFIEENLDFKINKYYQRHPTDKVFNIDIGGNKRVLGLLDLLYEDETLYLDRKFARYQELLNQYRRA